MRVKRNKINETARFLTKHFRDVPKAQTYKVPDQLFGASETQSASIRGQMTEISQKITQVNRDLRALAADIMKKVSQSADEVSTALAPIFAKAVCPSEIICRRRRNGNFVVTHREKQPIRLVIN